MQFYVPSKLKTDVAKEIYINQIGKYKMKNIVKNTFSKYSGKYHMLNLAGDQFKLLFKQGRIYL